MNRTSRRPLRAMTTLAGVAVVTATLVSAPSTAGARTVSVSPHGTIKITMKGNGHGHGMSQYGAQGAALAGRSYRQIVSFYYPHTTLDRLHRSWIRVGLSGFGSTTTVTADRHLTVQGVRGELPSRGIRRYRLVAGHHTGLVLQRLRSARGAHWRNYRFGLPDGAGFHRSNYFSLRLFQPDGSSTRYRGSLRAFRRATRGTAGGVHTVNRVTLNRYTAGVVPREMPSSWRRAATDAQAVAARSYGRYAVKHPRARHYDICDTTSCQVYGGLTRYDSHGTVLWTDFWRAAHDTSNRILRYGGHVIFAEFSASNGGWTAYGGQPYLTARPDPYESRSGDPYLSYSRRAKVANLGHYFGLAKLYKIEITHRDGHGLWGGRVEAVTLSGRDDHGHKKTVHTSGSGLQGALGLGTNWFTLSAS